MSKKNKFIYFGFLFLSAAIVYIFYIFVVKSNTSHSIRKDKVAESLEVDIKNNLCINMFSEKWRGGDGGNNKIFFKDGYSLKPLMFKSKDSEIIKNTLKKLVDKNIIEKEKYKFIAREQIVDCVYYITAWDFLPLDKKTKEKALSWSNNHSLGITKADIEDDVKIFLSDKRVKNKIKELNKDIPNALVISIDDRKYENNALEIASLTSLADNQSGREFFGFISNMAYPLITGEWLGDYYRSKYTVVDKMIKKGAVDVNNEKNNILKKEDLSIEILDSKTNIANSNIKIDIRNNSREVVTLMNNFIKLKRKFSDSSNYKSMNCYLKSKDNNPLIMMDINPKKKKTFFYKCKYMFTGDEVDYGQIPIKLKGEQKVLKFKHSFDQRKKISSIESME